jgi:hypothetical protein
MSDTVPDLAGEAEASDSAAGIIGPDIPIPITPDIVAREMARLVAAARAAEIGLNSTAIAKNSVAALPAKAKARHAALAHDPADWRAASDAQGWVEILGRYASIVTDAHRILTERAARAEATRAAGVIT